MARKRRPIRSIQPHERLPMHFAAEVGGDKEVALLETQGGDFKIQTQEHEYPLDLMTKAQIQPEDIKRLSNLEEAGIRGGIHSKRTYLMALKDGSLWIWKQTGAEERDEIFVYELAQRMFRKIVPEVQPVFVPKLGWGSAMRKVAGVPAGRVDGLHGYFHGNDEMMADLTAMLVLDYMTGNPDRHSNNWFIMHNDRLAAIDNGWAGEDLAMSFADVFQPARLAGMMEDERLWPQLLKGINALIHDLSGRGDEVRALAEAVKIDRKEAVDMVRLWEPKLASMAKLIRAEASRVDKARTYLKPGQEPPGGQQVKEGPRGGLYYETERHGATKADYAVWDSADYYGADSELDLTDEAYYGRQEAFLAAVKPAQITQSAHKYDLIAYKRRAYVAVNRFLRGQRRSLDQDDRRLVGSVDEALQESPGLAQSITVYRGVGRKVLKTLQVGDRFKDNGFVSTSIGQRFAENWAGAMMVIQVPAGAKGLWMEQPHVPDPHYSGIRTEQEILFPRGREFEVVEKGQRDGKLTVVVRMVA